MTIKTICGGSLAALAIAGGAAQAAHADTYCVSRPGCSGDWYPADLSTALLQAQQSASDGDTIKLGPGEFKHASGFAYAAGVGPENALVLEGIPGKTTLSTGLDSTSSGIPVLKISGTGKQTTYVSGIRVKTPVDAQQPASTGIRLTDAAAEDVHVTTSGAAGAGILAGIDLRDGAEVRRAEVALPVGKAGTGVLVDAPGVVVEDVRTSGGSRGVFVGDSIGARIRRARIDATAGGMQGIVCKTCGDLDVDNTVIRLGGDAVGLDAIAGTADPADIDASHLTIVGVPPNDAIAVRALGADMNGWSAIQLDNSVLHTVHWTLDAAAHLSGTGPALVATRDSSFAAGKEFTANGGTVDSQGTVAPNPQFVDQSGGDLRPRYSSALVDAGRAAGAFVTSVFDNALLKRQIDGNADGTTAPDIGAHEYRALPPVAKVSGPKTALAGEPITLDGTGSHGGDPGEAVASWLWELPDGTTATTPAVTLTLAPGTHHAILWVTDPTGKKSAWNQEITVPAPPPAGGSSAPGDAKPAPTPVPPPKPSPTPAPTPTPRPGSTPLLSNLSAKVVRRRPRLRLQISEPATLSVRLERRVGGRWRCVQRLTASHPSGARRIALRRLARPGAFRARVTARTAARSASARVRFRVR